MNLSDKWWYRLTQVVYFLVFGALFVFSALVTYFMLPKLDTYNSIYQFKCEDGSYRGEFDGSVLNFENSDFRDAAGKHAANFRCNNPTLEREAFYSGFKEYYENLGVYKDVDPSKNYKVVIKQKIYQGEISNFVVWLLVTLFGVPIFALLVRATFLYILIRSPFLSTFASPLWFLKKEIIKQQ